SLPHKFINLCLIIHLGSTSICTIKFIGSGTVKPMGYEVGLHLLFWLMTLTYNPLVNSRICIYKYLYNQI
ncbi:MAG: hypothetical protein NWQ43_13710, partial [Dolichospermum sp.]|nr:hypothetical protein [Dolichospermum sp.]